MRKPAVYLIMGISIVAVVVVILIALYTPGPRIENILALYRDDAQYTGLTIRYPLNETLFPPEIVPPTFHWEDAPSNAGFRKIRRWRSTSDTWLITIKFQDDEGRMNFLVRESQWTPESDQWEAIKKRSLENHAIVTILGVNRWRPKVRTGNQKMARYL